MNTSNINSYISSLKTKVLRIFLIVCTVLIPVLACLEIKKGDMLNFFVEIFFELPIVIALIFSLRGNYKVPSIITVCSVYVLALLLSLIVKPTGEILFYRNNTYFLLALSIGIFLLNDNKNVLIGYFAMVIVQIVFAFGFLIPAGFESGKVITMLVMSLAMYGLIGFMLMEYVSVSRKQSKLLDEEKENSQSRLDHMSSMMSGASDNFEAVSSLSNKVTDVSQLVADTVTAMNQIEIQVNQIDEGATISTNAIEQITQSVTDLNNSISDLVNYQKESNDSSNKMIASVEFVSTSTNNERNVLHTLADTSDEGYKQLAELLKNIKSVEENIKAIHEMLGSISNIAEKTNLLAMNAAIEAAHAGEAGKGFAVVAAEIRKLADASSQNSGRINNVLDMVTNSIHQVSEQSNLTQSAFDKISEGIKKSVLVIDQISTSTMELSVNGQQLLSSMANVELCSNEIKDGGEKVGDAQISLKRTQDNLRDSVVELNKNTLAIKEKNDSVLEALSNINQISEEGRRQAEALQELTQKQ